MYTSTFDFLQVFSLSLKLKASSFLLHVCLHIPDYVFLHLHFISLHINVDFPQVCQTAETKRTESHGATTGAENRVQYELLREVR